MKGHDQDGRDWIAEALRLHEGPLVRYAARITGDLELARDIVQDCFLRLCRQRREELDGHLKEWLFKVCRNRAFDFLRKARRMDAGTNDLVDLDRTPGAGPAPLERAEASEDARRLLAVLADLPERQQEILRLKFQEGMSYRQISAVTGASIGNVGVILHGAIRTLRARLGDGTVPTRRQA